MNLLILRSFAQRLYHPNRMVRDVHHSRPMSSRISRILVATIILSTVTAAGTRQPKIAVSELERRINALVNGERRSGNLNPLDLDQNLSKIARAHSQDMANRGFFNHVNPDGEKPWDRLSRAGYSCPQTSGENIFQNNLYSRVTINGNRKSYDWNSLEQIAGSTVSGWMHSSGHRKNILNRAYRKTGMGAAIGVHGQVFITQMFCG